MATENIAAYQMEIKFDKNNLSYLESLNTNDGEIEITEIYGGISPYHLNWENGDSSEVLTDLEDGIYELIISDSTGCEKAFELEVSFNSSLDGISNEKKQFSLSPNPAQKNTQINLFSNQEITQNLFISIFDASGKLIKKKKSLTFNSNQAALESPNISGIYFLKIEDEKRDLNFQKLVVE